MTKDEVLQRIEQIRIDAEKEKDSESAHEREDSLREDFIEFVAQRDDELGELAKIVLSTNDICFSRWCA